MSWLQDIAASGLRTALDVAPILVALVFFQVAVLRRKPPNIRRLIGGFVYVVIGLTLFLSGLEKALFPLGKVMAEQLTDPAFLSPDGTPAGYGDYLWVYLFAAAIGFATTIAEPALIAVAIKAREVSGGTVGIWGLRIAVAIGVAAGVSLGTFRIVAGVPLYWFLIAGYVVVMIQTTRASRSIVPLAYDSGGVSTSTVTVPLVTAIGLGLASTIPGRSAALDGFGLIAFACLFPMMTVMGYAKLGEWRRRRAHSKRSE